MAALVGCFPTDFFTHLAAGVEVVRCGVPEVADVLDPIALLVVGDVPAHSVDKGHASSVAERSL